MKFISVVLQILGALALAVIALGLWMVLPGSRSTKNPVFILNWAGINTSQKWNVIYSSTSSRTFTGDHIDFYCIQLERFDLQDVRAREGWRAGPESDPVLAEAIVRAADWAHRQANSCFPAADRANSSAMKSFVWSTTIHDREPTAAQIILFEPATKKLFYVDYKT